MIKAFALTLLLSLGACSCSSLSQPRNMLKSDQFAIIETSEFRVMCYEASRSACGIRLSDCTDGRIHECTKDVQVFDLEEIRRALTRGGMIR